MAYEVNAYGAQPKVRNPLGVFGLGLITIGIYWIVWYYKINNEMKDYGRAYNDTELAESNPTNSVLAVTLGALLIVPAIVSYYRTVGRIRRVQRIGGVELTSGWLVLVLYLVISIAIPPYLQSGLNELWKRYPAIDEGEGEAGALPAASPSDSTLAGTPPPPAPGEPQAAPAPPPAPGESAPAQAPPPPPEGETRT